MSHRRNRSRTRSKRTELASKRRAKTDDVLSKLLNCMSFACFGKPSFARRSLVPWFFGPVKLFVSGERGTLFAIRLGHAVLEEDDEVVQRWFPVPDGQGPLA